MLPDQIPLPDAAAWLSIKLRRQVSTDYFQQLSSDGVIELIEVSTRVNSREDPPAGAGRLRVMGALQESMRRRHVLCISKCDLEKLAYSNAGNVLSESSWAAICGALREVLRDEFPKDAALIAALSENFPDLRGISKRNLEKAFAISADRMNS